jgi:hypothetical protein
MSNIFIRAGVSMIKIGCALMAVPIMGIFVAFGLAILWALASSI